jgi:hypothetical protein
MKKEETEVVTGKVDGPKNLYEAMGLKADFGNYKTDSLDEYMSSLIAMNLSDLQAHCVRIGIKPNSDRRNLTEKLKKEFRANRSSYRGALQPTKNGEMSKEKRKKALDIMRGVV